MTALKLILIVALVVVMVLVLMAINYFVVKGSMGNDHSQDSMKMMRNDLERDERVITGMSVFYQFLVRDGRSHRSKTKGHNRRRTPLSEL